MIDQKDIRMVANRRSFLPWLLYPLVALPVGEVVPLKIGHAVAASFASSRMICFIR